MSLYIAEMHANIYEQRVYFENTQFYYIANSIRL